MAIAQMKVYEHDEARVHKLALIGFGTVGQGLVEILRDKGETLASSLGFEPRVVAVADVVKGSLYHPDGLDPNLLLQTVRDTGKVDRYPDTPGLVRGWDSLRTIEECNADTVVEVTFTDVATGQPAISHCRAAFESGKNVVTSNKGPVALKLRALSELAEQSGVRWGFEGSVMSGTPALRMPITALAGNDIRAVRGILNGTTNYILSQMETGSTYSDALAQAQRLGYAEADPTNDVEGYDARYKIVILANVLMGAGVRPENVACKGISHLTTDDVKRAAAEGKRWKLLAHAVRDRNRPVDDPSAVRASVGPEMVPLHDPLASVTGATNAVTYECDLAGPITLIGAGAGRKETGYSLLIDLINIARGRP